MTSPLLQLQQTSFAYGRMVVVRDVDLDVEAGRLVALIGVNGSGKTTLLRGVLGLTAAAHGRVVYGGRDITRWPTEKRVRSGLVLVPEGRGVLAEMTVSENLELGAMIARDAGHDVSEDFASVYERFPILERRRRQLAGTLSGGEQQMLVVGRALLARPTLLLLDEPSFGLSPQAVEEVFAAILDLKAGGLTILMSEQNATQALEVADSTYIMDHGELRFGGTQEELAREGVLAGLYMGAHRE
jgi:branched-chain amino acid transport system ATP-binding protein